MKLAIYTPGLTLIPTTGGGGELSPPNLKPRALNDGHEQPGSAHTLKRI